MSTTQKKILDEEIREVFKVLESACKVQGLTVREALELLEDETEEDCFKKYYKRQEVITECEKYVRSMTSMTKKEKVIILKVLQIMAETAGCPFSTVLVEQLNMRLKGITEKYYGKQEIHDISVKFLKEYFRREKVREPLDFTNHFAVRFKLDEVAKKILK